MSSCESDEEFSTRRKRKRGLDPDAVPELVEVRQASLDLEDCRSPCGTTQSIKREKARRMKAEQIEDLPQNKLRKVLAHRQSDLNRRVRMNELFSQLEQLVEVDSTKSSKSRTQSAILEKSVEMLHDLQSEVAQLRAMVQQPAQLDEMQTKSTTLRTAIESIALMAPLSNEYLHLSTFGSDPSTSSVSSFFSSNTLSSMLLQPETSALLTSSTIPSMPFVDVRFRKRYVSQFGHLVPVAVQSILISDERGNLSSIVARVRPLCLEQPRPALLLSSTLNDLMPFVPLHEDPLAEIKVEPPLDSALWTVDETRPEGLLIATGPVTELRLKYVDENLATMLDYASPRDMITKTIREISHPDDGDAVLVALARSRGSLT